jgi:flagellar biosynthesis protein FlhG
MSSTENKKTTEYHSEETQESQENPLSYSQNEDLLNLNLDEDAQALKEAQSLLMQSTQMSPQVWAFGGAKGGIGRSLVCATTACLLAQKGYRVVALDFDLGAANLHTFLGLSQTEKNLEQWLLGQFEHLQEICSPTHIPNLSLITTGSSIFNPSLPSIEQIRKLMVEALELECDYLLIDLGAGIHSHTLDFFNLAGRSFMLTTPEPSAIQNTYAFYKAALLRRAEIVLKTRPWLNKILLRAALSKGKGRITSLGEMLDMLKELDHELAQEMMNCLKGLKVPLIINRAGRDDELQVIKALDRICSRYLHLEIEHTLTILEDKEIRHLIRQMLPIHEFPEDSQYMKHMNAWIDRLLEQKLYTPAHEDFLELASTPSFLSLSLNHQNQEESQDHNQLLMQTMHQMRGTIDSIRHEFQPNQQLSFAMPTSNPQTNSQPTISFDSRLTGSPIASPVASNLSIQQINLLDPYGFNSELNHLRKNFPQPNIDYRFNPLPLQSLELSDPPEHEVLAYEEEIRLNAGSQILHLKTVDLAPFRMAIRTTIHESFKQIAIYEESYADLYEQFAHHEIGKRVERIHQQNIELLSKGGIHTWREAKI